MLRFHNIHWYVAILPIDQAEIILEIQINTTTRHITVENNVQFFGALYHHNIWVPHKQYYDREKVIKPKKQPIFIQSKIQSQEQCNELILETTQTDPDQSENKISRCLNFT